jgi:hypothetical protein
LFFFVPFCVFFFLPPQLCMHSWALGHFQPCNGVNWASQFEGCAQGPAWHQYWQLNI